MKFGRPREVAPTRRMVAAQRQAEVHADPAAASYQRNRVLRQSPIDREEEPSERQAAHELRRSRRRLVRFLGGAFIATGLLLVVLFNLSATIRVVTPGPIKDSSAYADILAAYYGARPLERLQVFTDRAALTAFFLQHSPEVKSVDVSSGGLATADLKLTFRQAVVQWSSGDKTYFVDESGVTFEKNYLSSPKVIVRDQSGVPVETGKEVINRQFLGFLGRVVAGFSKNGIMVSDVVLPPQTVRQAVIQLENKSYQIKMTIDRSADEQVIQAIQAMRWFESRQAATGFIDVRAQQRAFYR